MKQKANYKSNVKSENAGTFAEDLKTVTESAYVFRRGNIRGYLPLITLDV